MYITQILIIWSGKLHVQVYRFAPKPSSVSILHAVVILVEATAVFGDDAKSVR